MYLSVIVEDDHVADAQVSGAVHGLESHASRDGTVPDNRNAVVPPLQNHQNKTKQKARQSRARQDEASRHRCKYGSMHATHNLGARA